MKQVLQRYLLAGDKSEKQQLAATIFMIILFLSFWGASFYILLTSLN